MHKKTEVVIILENIRSAHNVGAIFRSGECFGVSKIYLCGYCPAPIDRFGRDRKDISKTALGAEQIVKWEVIADIHDLLQKLKKDGYNIAAIERIDGGIGCEQLANLEFEKVALIFGNEVDGITDKVLTSADQVYQIKQFGQKESLNVTTACGISLFALRSFVVAPRDDVS